MKDLADKLQIGEDWSKLNKNIIQRYGGTGLLERYNSSPSALLRTVFPEYKQACRQFVTKLVQDLKLSGPRDLINIPSG